MTQSWESYIRDQDDQAELAMLDDEARVVIAVALAEPADSTWAYLTHSAYKHTSCGASLYHTDKVAGRVIISSIVEGIEQTTEAYTLQWPFTAQKVEDAIAKVEAEAQELWHASHGCEDCGPEDFSGCRSINPNCPTCQGSGVIL
jgi:hypothetical protein